MKVFVLALCFLFSSELFAKTPEEVFLTKFTTQFQQVMLDFQDFNSIVATNELDENLLKVYACQAVAGHNQMGTLLLNNEQYIGLIHVSTYQLLEDMLKTYSNYVSIETCLNSKGFL